MKLNQFLVKVYVSLLVNQICINLNHTECLHHFPIISCDHTKLEILSSVGQQLGWPTEEYSHKQKWSHEAHYSHQVRNLQLMSKLNSKTAPESN